MLIKKIRYQGLKGEEQYRKWESDSVHFLAAKQGVKALVALKRTTNLNKFGYMLKKLTNMQSFQKEKRYD